jgi:hypothetical protein
MMSGATRSKFDPKGGGGWNWILSDLKSLLETGKTMDARELNTLAGNARRQRSSRRPNFNGAAGHRGRRQCCDRLAASNVRHSLGPIWNIAG